MKTKVTKIASTNTNETFVYIGESFYGDVTITRFGDDIHMCVGNGLITSAIVEYDKEFGLVYTNNSIYLVEHLE